MFTVFPLRTWESHLQETKPYVHKTGRVDGRISTTSMII